nr:hypothetical protein [Tanacetum cinerariifolium]
MDDDLLPTDKLSLGENGSSHLSTIHCCDLKDLNIFLSALRGMAIAAPATETTATTVNVAAEIVVGAGHAKLAMMSKDDWRRWFNICREKGWKDHAAQKTKCGDSSIADPKEGKRLEGPRSSGNQMW